MTTSDWVLIATAIITVLGLGSAALIAPYVAELVKRRFFAPELGLSFELSPPMSRYSPRRSRDDPPVEVPAYDFHIEVRNDGQSKAREGEAVVEELWLYDAAGRPSRFENFLPVNLRYDSVGSRFVDINPNRRIPWNLGLISEGIQDLLADRLIDATGHDEPGLLFILDLLAYPFNQPNSLSQGTYGVRVSLYSENAETAAINLAITWTGNWRDDERAMFREIVIEEVDSFRSR